MDNNGCQSRYTVCEGLVLKCEIHLHGNPFRQESFKHAALFAGTQFYWSTPEEDND